MAIAFLNELLQQENKLIFFSSNNIEYKRLKNIFKGCQLLTISNKKRLVTYKTNTEFQYSNQKNLDSNVKDTEFDVEKECIEEIKPFIVCDIHKSSEIHCNIEESLKFANFDQPFLTDYSGHIKSLNKFYNDNEPLAIEDEYFYKLNDIYKEYIKTRNSNLPKDAIKELKKSITEKYFK